MSGALLSGADASWRHASIGSSGRIGRADVSGPGLAFAEQVRFVTVADELTAAGFTTLGRRALLASRSADRIDVSEASRYLGAAGEEWGRLAPDAVGLRALADEVREMVATSPEFFALHELLDGGSLRDVTVGLVSALQSASIDVTARLSPTSDRNLAAALRRIDLHFGSALRSLAGHPAASSVGEMGAEMVAEVFGEVGAEMVGELGGQTGGGRDGQRATASASFDGVRVATAVLGILGSRRNSFSSPLRVPKSAVPNH